MRIAPKETVTMKAKRKNADTIWQQRKRKGYRNLLYAASKIPYQCEIHGKL